MGYHTMVIENTLTAKELRRFRNISKMMEQVTHLSVCSMVHGNVDIFGKKVELSRPSNWRDHDKNDEEKAEISRVYHQKRMFTILKRISDLRQFGFIPSVGELEIPSSLDFSRLFNPVDGAEYAATKGIDLASTITLAAVHMCTAENVGLINSVELINGTMIGRERAVRFTQRPGMCAWFDWQLKLLDGTIVEPVNRALLSTRNTAGEEWINNLGDAFGFDVADARSGIQSTKWALHEQGTNPSFNMGMVMPFINVDPSYYGKGLGKRNDFAASRSWTAIHYSANITEDKWVIGDNTFTVLINSTPNDSGDGASYMSRKTLRRFITAMGANEDTVRSLSKSGTVYSVNVKTLIGNVKGDLHIEDDAAEWPYVQDIVVDASSLDRKKALRPEAGNRISASLTPKKVKDNLLSRTVVINGRQAINEVFRVVDDSIIEDTPAWFLEDLRNQLEEDYQHRVLDAMEEEENEVSSHTGQKIWADLLNEKGNLDANVVRSERKRAYYANMHSMFAGRTAINRYLFNPFMKMEGLMADFQEEKFCGLPMPATRVRTIVGAYTGKSTEKPTEWGITFRRKEGAVTPYTVVVGDALMRDPVFQFALEYCDHDDGPIVMRLVDSKGHKKAFLWKEPTSTHAGELVEIDEHTADTIGVRELPMQETKPRRSRKEIEAWLADEKRPQARPLGRENRIALRNPDPVAYAKASAKIMPKLGNVGTFSALMTLLSRSDLLVKEILLQASDGVDSLVGRTTSFSHVIDQVIQMTVDEINKGSKFDTRYLLSPRNAFLEGKLREAYIDKYPMGKYVVEGRLAPNAKDFNREERIHAAVQEIHTTLAFNVEVLLALANGPVTNFLVDDTVEGVSELAIKVFKDTKKIQGDKSLTWADKEDALYQLALETEREAYLLADYQPGMLAKAVAQIHAAYDNSRSYETGGLQPVPGARQVPALEYLSEWELRPHFAHIAEPAFFVQVKNIEALTEGESYMFSSEGGTVYVGEEEYDYLDAEEAEFATTQVPDARLWSELLQGQMVEFRGIVGASEWRNDDDRVAVFVPSDPMALLRWDY